MSPQEQLIIKALKLIEDLMDNTEKYKGPVAQFKLQVALEAVRVALETGAIELGEDTGE